MKDEAEENKGTGVLLRLELEKMYSTTGRSTSSPLHYKHNHTSGDVVNTVAHVDHGGEEEHDRNDGQLDTSRDQDTDDPIDNGSMSEPTTPTTRFVRNTVLTKLSKWNKLENYGSPLFDGLIPLKTPISNKYLYGTHWKPFSIHDFIHEQWLQYGRIVGMMIDLSNHDCIYDYEAISVPVEVSNVSPCTENNGYSKEENCSYMPLLYIKHRCISKECPDLQSIKDFIETVKNFKSKHPHHYIGVHCAYGFNRTGFVLCSFLVEYCNLSVDEALKKFASSRKPGIKHKWFVEELKRRYEKRLSEMKSLEEEEQETLVSTTDSSESCSELEQESEDDLAELEHAAIASDR
jgi:hypothetical protein